MLEIKVDHGDVHIKALGTEKELIAETGTVIHALAGQLSEAHQSAEDKLFTLKMLSAVVEYAVGSVKKEVQR